MANPSGVSASNALAAMGLSSIAGQVLTEMKPEGTNAAYENQLMLNNDEVEIEGLLEQIGADLRHHAPEPKFCTEEKSTRLFSKEFLVLVNNISQKW